MVNRNAAGKIESLTLDIKTVIAICLFLCGLVAASVANDAAVHYRLTSIEASIDDVAGDRWRGDDMELWVERTARLNPDWQPAAVFLRHGAEDGRH